MGDSKLSDTEKLLEILNISSNIVLKKAIRGSKGITGYSLIEALITYNSIDEAAASFGYISTGPVRTSISQILIDKFPEKKKVFGKGRSNSGRWRVSLLDLLDKKHCYGCKNNLPKECFGRNFGKGAENLRTTCKSCHTFESKKQKTHISNRTPSWAELSEIREFYNNCPLGSHVDHIIPLRGTHISGLHVLGNLQYLTAKENLTKSNIYI